MKSLFFAPALLAAAFAVTPSPTPQKRVEAAPPIYVYNDGGSYFLTLDGGGSSGGQPVVATPPLYVYNDGGSYGITLDASSPLPVEGTGSIAVYNDGGSYGVTAPLVATQGALTLYVDTAGNDSNACTSSGASACLTIQGALRKVPKLLQHNVTVNVGAGNFGCFTTSGFTQDQTVQTTTGGLLIQGALANSTLASGSATGTATGGTAASGSTQGTMIDTGATWTTNDLVGRFLVITGGTGSGQTRVISSNTGTVITVVGGTFTATNGTSTYAIQDAATVLNSGIAPIPRADQTTSGTGSCLTFVGNDFRDLGGLQLKNFRLTTVGFGVYVYGGSAPRFTQIQDVPASGTTTRFVHSGTGQMYLDVVYSVLPAQTAGSQTGAHIDNNIAALVNGIGAFVSNSLLVNGQYAGFWTGLGNFIFSGSEARNTDRGVEIYKSNGTFTNSRFTCAGGQGQWAIAVGERHDGATTPAGVNVTTVNFANCWYAIEQGGGNLYALGLTGLTRGPTMNVRGGGKVTINGATASGLRGSDGGLYDFQIDAYGAVDPTLGAWTDFLGVGDGGTVGSCIGTVAGASSICTQP